MIPMLALIGGEGTMPKRIARAVRSSGRSVFLLAITGITPHDLVNDVDDVVWIPFGRLGKAIKECVKRDITEVVMAGRVHHRLVFSLSSFAMDWSTLRLWWSLPDKRTDTILSAIADAFSRRGITVVNSIHYLQESMAFEGVLTCRSPTGSENDDILFGLGIVQQLGHADIGQTVVVKNRSVVAVEAMEGTDKCIERAGEIAGKGCVVVKMAKPSQDMRFDVPVIGVNTIKRLASINASTLAIEAEKTLIVDSDTLDVADSFGITVVAIRKEFIQSTQEHCVQ